MSLDNSVRQLSNVASKAGYKGGNKKTSLFDDLQDARSISVRSHK